jgi:Protein of unknown function (DUF4238)
MSDPRRHHFNPEFHLRQWVGADGLLCEIKKSHGKVEAQRKSPKATGFERDLYRTDGVPAELAQHVETNFMSKIDNDAARALQKIVTGDGTPWAGDERNGWTTYLLSLFFRNPENVAVIKDHIRAAWDEGMRALEADYASRRRPTDPDTFEGYVALTNPAAPEIGASNFLMETISNERLGPAIFDMHWSRHDLRRSKFPLLTSDRPLVMPLGLGDPQAYVALAASPSVLFVAARDQGFAGFIAGWKHTDLVKVLNKTVVSQARKFVWATDDSQLEFIRRNISAAPDRPILTEEQKRESLAVARGKAGR